VLAWAELAGPRSLRGAQIGVWIRVVAALAAPLASGFVHLSSYYDLESVQAGVHAGQHREIVGGLWHEIGELQFAFLTQQGLTPEMRLLDIGCGSLRGGVHFVRYLAPGHYYGVDISADLLRAGYDVELAAAGLQDRLPRENLRADARFAFDAFGVVFDMALAQSLFTHLPLNHIRLCLGRLAPQLRPGGSLFATIFVCEGDDWFEPVERVAGIVTTYPDNDPYHYRYADIAACCAGLPWEMRPIGDWGHPRGQSMVQLVRTPAA
jgi:SAM-dependent methyltransferase